MVPSVSPALSIELHADLSPGAGSDSAPEGPYSATFEVEVVKACSAVLEEGEACSISAVEVGTLALSPVSREIHLEMSYVGACQVAKPSTHLLPWVVS
jgi:hypothetical protein